jgi:hypothetical protein
MRKTVFIFAFISLISCNNRTVRSDSQSVSENSPAAVPKLEFTEEIHNFGRLKAGEIAVYNFVFINSREKVLEIKNIETGCTCVSVESPAGIIKPGEKGVLKVIFDTSGLYGTQFQAFRITTMDGIKVDLAVTAEVINENIKFNN